MTVSVILAVYNGVETLVRQLDSIRQQTLAPDEVLICDDQSTDSTVHLIKSYICQYRLLNWHLTENKTNLGWKQNFIQGIRKCSGDIIFLCDQDDRWYPNKISVMKKAIEEDPNILLLSCNVRVQYEGNAIKATVYQGRKKESVTTISRYRFSSHFFMNPRPGCSYAFRKAFFDDIQSGWKKNYPHDEFIWLMAAMQNGAYLMNVVLMDFIRGEKNASDIRYKDISMQSENLAYIFSMLENMEEYAVTHPNVPEEYLVKIRNAKIWCMKRMKLMTTRNPLRWIYMMPYWAYYNSVKNCLSDLYLVLFGSFRRRSI